MSSSTVSGALGRTTRDAEYARTHPEVPPGDYAMLTIRDTGDGSNVASLEALGHKAGVRKGRSGRTHADCYDVIDQPGGYLCISRQADETVIKIYLPCAGESQPGAEQASAATRDIRLGLAHVRLKMRLEFVID